MTRTAWQESPFWLAAGWTMFQFLWIGVLPWMLGLLLRWTLHQTTPHIRYVVALGLLLTTSVIPILLFATALGAFNTPVLLDGQRSAIRSSTHTDAIVPPESPPMLASGRPSDPEIQRGQSASNAWTTQREWSSTLLRQFVIVRNLACRGLPWLWLMGTPSILLVLACGVRGADRLRIGGRVLTEGDIIATCERLKGVLCVSRHVAVVVCDRVAAPVLTGIVRPAILLPSSLLTGFSQEQIEMVFLHELSHVRRWDNLVNLVQRIIEAGLFFHPVIWWLSNWVRLEREECCDHVVVAHTGRPQVYAETLATLALPGITPRHAAAAMADCHLVTRIRHILKLEEEIMNVSQKFIMTVAGLVIVAGYFSVSFGQTQESRPTPAEKPIAVIRADALVNYSINGGMVPSNIVACWQNDAVAQNGQPLQAGPPTTAWVQDSGNITQLFVARRALVSNWKDSWYNQQSVQWTAQQATGAPDSPDASNNQGTAWCPATADGQEEWLELSYAEPIEPLAVVVYECSKPGALTRVIAFDTEGNELNAWNGKDPSPQDNGDGSAISVVPLKLKKIKIVRLRLYLDSPQVPGWNEIDAVGILDVKGSIHWATSATASSNWVDPAASQTTFQFLPTMQQGIDARVSYGAWLPTAIDVNSAGVAGVVTLQPLSVATLTLQNQQSPGAVLFDYVNPQTTTAEGATNPDKISPNPANESVTQFEERIKKLESELAGLRDALKQLKPGN